MRQSIKNAIQQSLQGIPGIKSVFTARQRLTQNQQTPAITIYLPDVKEQVMTVGLPAGKRKLEITGLLEIIMVDPNSKVEDGEAQFDNLLDLIDEKLRQNFSLQGTVLGAAIKNLQTHVGAPQMVEGNNIFRSAVKKFDILLSISGLSADMQ